MTHPSLEITEKEFQGLVEQAARVCGWTLVYHTFNSRRSAHGFPDLVCVHPVKGKVVWAELKTTKGRLSPAQREWISALETAGQEVYVWRPADWPQIEAVFGGRNI